jgi:hypothetical protein
MITQRIFNMTKFKHLHYRIAFLLASICVFTFNSTVQAQYTTPRDPMHGPTYNYSTTCNESSSCGGNIDCCTADTWGLYGQADAVFWTLGGSNRALIQRFDFRTGDTPTVFTADDLRSTRATPRILLGLNLTPCFAVEGQYNGFSPWKSWRTFIGDGDLLTPGTAFQAGTNDYFMADRMIVSAETIFHSAEINLVRKIKETHLSTLAGFRYINFDEKFGLNSTPNMQVPDYSSDYLIHAKNDLYGGQLGLKWTQGLSERFGLNFVGKAGIYGNNARQATWLRDDNNTFEHRNVSMKKNSTAFVGELNLGGYFRITEGLSFIGGYNLMWVGDTARAADQLDFTFDANSSHFVATDTLFMHGANVGLAWNF